MRLFLVRHGETMWNLESRFQGWADEPLSPLGEEQARQLARAICGYHFQAAYCSDLRRAYQTAEILLRGRGMSAVRLKALREMNIGELDGLTEMELQTRFAGVLTAWRSNPAEVLMPGGENLRGVQERVWLAVESILEKHRGENVLLVGHHTVNKTLLCRLLRIPLRRFRVLRQPPCTLSIIDFLEDRYYVQAVNINWRDRTSIWLDLPEEIKERVRGAEGLIFDLDGVLLDSMKYYAAAWRAALAESGVVPPEVEFYRREGEDAARSVRHFFQEAGLEAGEREVKKVIERVYEIYQGFPGIKPRPGAFGVLRKLRDAGRRLALVTGSPRSDIDRLLTGAQIGLFDVVVCGDEVRTGKPDPEPFLSAMEKLGLPAERLLVIENAPYGIRAAKAAGLLTAAIPSTLPPEELHEADLILDSLERLPGWLGLL